MTEAEKLALAARIERDGAGHVEFDGRGHREMFLLNVSGPERALILSALRTRPPSEDEIARAIYVDTSDTACAVACMFVSNPQGVIRQDGDGWQKRVNDLIRALRDERNAAYEERDRLRAEIARVRMDALEEAVQIIERHVKQQSNGRCCDGCWCGGLKTGIAAIRKLEGER
jgi:hypothetical protein